MDPPSTHSLLSLFLFLFLFLLHFPSPSHPLRISVSKDPSSRHYFTRLLFPRPTAIDLAGTSLWLDCGGSGRFPASSYRSELCSRAGALARLGSNGGCGVSVRNPVTGAGGAGELHTFGSGGGELLFVCAPPSLLHGFAAGVRGVAGLGRSRISLPSQLAAGHGFNWEFAVCFPSTADSDGAIFLGGGNDLTDYLMYTPMIYNPVGKGGVSDGNYFVGVTAIKVAGKQLPLDASLLSIDQNGQGGTTISTISPFTILETTIFNTMIDAFSTAATAMGITRMPPVPPFQACFSTKNVTVTGMGPAVPTIEMVLQSETVRWKVYGANSMVFVTKDVMCLAVVDGGRRPTTSIVIGGHQLEDNLVLFDVGTSRIGFSSSLLARGVSCSSITNLLSDQ